MKSFLMTCTVLCCPKQCYFNEGQCNKRCDQLFVFSESDWVSDVFYCGSLFQSVFSCTLFVRGCIRVQSFPLTMKLHNWSTFSWAIPFWGEPTNPQSDLGSSQWIPLHCCCLSVQVSWSSTMERHPTRKALREKMIRPAQRAIVLSVSANGSVIGLSHKREGSWRIRSWGEHTPLSPLYGRSHLKWTLPMVAGVKMDGGQEGRRWSWRTEPPLPSLGLRRAEEVQSGIMMRSYDFTLSGLWGRCYHYCKARLEHTHTRIHIYTHTNPVSNWVPLICHALLVEGHPMQYILSPYLCQMSGWTWCFQWCKIWSSSSSCHYDNANSGGLEQNISFIFCSKLWFILNLAPSAFAHRSVFTAIRVWKLCLQDGSLALISSLDKQIQPIKSTAHDLKLI